MSRNHRRELPENDRRECQTAKNGFHLASPPRCGTSLHSGGSGPRQVAGRVVVLEVVGHGVFSASVAAPCVERPLGALAFPNACEKKTDPRVLRGIHAVCRLADGGK
jgi:hypothetical protein